MTETYAGRRDAWFAPDRPVNTVRLKPTPHTEPSPTIHVTWFAPDRPVRPAAEATAVGDLLCIDCSGSLIAAATLDFDRIQCACGVTYTLQLLTAVDVELWELARTERLFFRDGECVLLTTPLEAIREWPGWAGGGA